MWRGCHITKKGGQLPSDEMLIAAGAFGDKERYRNIAKNNANLIN